MTNKEYLSRPYYLQKRIDAKHRRLASLESFVSGSSPTLSDLPKGSPSPTKFEDMVVRILDLKDSLRKDEENLAAARREVSLSISEVTDPRYSGILESRYLLYMSWEDIIVQTNYCRSYVYELHERALRQVRQKT